MKKQKSCLSNKNRKKVAKYMKEDLRVIKTKENIKKSMLHLLKKYAFKDITMSMLVDECRINKTTFYRHYSDKYDLIEKISKDIYGAGNVVYTDLANEQIAQYEKMGYKGLAVCMAKTPNSITDDAKVLGAPTGFTITVREVRLSAGAGFIVPLTGAVMTMPGLPKVPAAVKMEAK